MLSKVTFKFAENARRCNIFNIISLLEDNPDAKLLDLGCDDGSLTLELANKIGSKRIYGMELNPDRKTILESKGIIPVQEDLNNLFPFDDRYFDVIHSNQVIEHLYNPDLFLQEIRRVLNDHGYVIISTENLASWHNIFATILGWQPFSLTNISAVKLGIGNPLGYGRNTEPSSLLLNHIHVFSYRGLKEICQINGFKIIKCIGAGYYPIPACIGKIDPRHAVYLTLKLAKQLSPQSGR